ncbi:glycine zipper 2TM domain-containing protein [Oxalobacteraceae bacterium]|nr:glycine zipper 2TM domain-containing protein [Oxalobacteraceae bacterium]
MEKISTVSRIHPLIAGAAVSVTLLALVGTAAIAGWLPTSKGEIAPAVGPNVTAMTPGLSQGLAPSGSAQAGLQPATLQTEAPREAAAPVAHKPRPHHNTQTAHATQTNYERPPQQQQAPAPAPAPAQPNYVGIGAGAVIGGLLGNQVGKGNGRTLATVAGVIGGGMLGNQVQKQVQQQPEQR